MQHMQTSTFATDNVSTASLSFILLYTFNTITSNMTSTVSFSGWLVGV